MEFRILGPFEVRNESGAVVLGGIKPRTVLAVLLLHSNEPVHAERLALALWGEDAPARAAKTVQVYVSRLRKALGDAQILATTPAGYCLRVRTDELDAERFERLVEDGRRALAARQAEHAAAVLREALALWRGPPLAEWGFEPFAQAEIARLQEQRLLAIETRLEADLAAGHHAALVGELRQLVAANPTRERLAGQLMLALYRCGQQGDALEAFHAARRVLVAQIGVEPGPALRRLQDAILRQDVSLEPQASVSELPQELDAATAPALVGRGAELAWLCECWERTRTATGALVTVTGIRGIGKTRIAAELAGEVHRLGALVVYCSGKGSPEAVHAALSRAGEASRATLLVIDNADEAGAEVLGELQRLTRAIADMPVLALVIAEDADALTRFRGDGALTLRPLDAAAVRAIAVLYAPSHADEDVPIDWLLDTSGGVPRRVHEVASRWASRQAARRVRAVAPRTAAGRAELRSMESELADDVVALQTARDRVKLDDVEPRVVCPFKGLASFDVADAPYFFGRERLVAELVARLVGAPLLAVVGPSGSGKSSVLRAGLLPALAGGVLPGSEHWEQVLIRPGTHPVRELAAALANVDGDHRVVLAVDQFEETFTVCGDETERSEFVAELVHAAQDAGGRYVVVIALRADYYGRCAAYRELSALIAANNVLVRSMQRDELQRAVEGPSQRAGMRIEAALVQALVADVEHEPGGLPLLSTALLELWQHRDGHHLRHATYERTGGVHGAVARLAEDAYGQLDEAQQAIARGVLMRLVGAGEGDRVERRRVALGELEINRNEDVARIVALLTDRRLLTVSAGTVEVAHEALLREWPRLRDWTDEDRAGLRIQRALSGAAKEWQRLGGDDGALLRGSRLSEVVEWRDHRRPAFNELEREFLAASEATIERERVTRRRRTQLLMGAVATVVLAGVVVAVAALFAARARAIAASQDLAAQSAAITETDPGLAFTLAREALKRHDTAQAQNAMRQATLAYRVTAVAQASKGLTYAPDLSPDGQLAVTPGADGKVILWRLGRVLSKKTLATHQNEALGAAFDPEAKLVASVSYDGKVALTPVSGGHTKTLLRLAGVDKEFGYSIDAAPGMLVVGTYAGAVRLIPTGRDGAASVLGRHKGRQRILVVSFNRDGTKVVSGGDDGQAYIWDLRSRTSIRLPHPKKNTVFGASFSPDGMTVATAAQDGRVRLWNANTGRPARKPLKVDDKALYSVRFSADGLRVVTGGERGVARISDVRNGQLLSEMAGGNAHYVDFVPGSDTIIGTGDEGMLRMWEPLSVRTPRRSGTSPSFSPDGKNVVSGSERGNVLLWDLAKGDRQLPGHDDHSITSFSPDGTHILSASWDGSVRLYDVTSKRSRKLQFPMFAKYAIAMNRAGQIAVGGYGGGGIVIQDVDGANRIKLPYSSAVGGLAFSPDATRLASASQDGTARIWNLQTRKVERVIDTKTMVNSVSYDAQGRHLATALADGTVRIWPIDGGRPVILAGHAGPVNTAQFSHRGNRIVTAGDDGTVRVWDAAGGDTLLVLHRHEGTASGADFSPDDHSVVSAGEDGMRITPCEVCGSLTRVMRIAAKRAPRALSDGEHQRLMDRGD